MLYTPSPLETQLIEYGDVTDHVCELGKHNTQVTGWKTILSRGNGWKALMSKMPDGSLIEPLSVTLRHPFARMGCNFTQRMTSVVDISYSHIPSLCGIDKMSTEWTGPKTRKIREVASLMDMGCTTYGPGKKHARSASGFGPSIPLFENWYEDRCYKFENIVGWEAKKFNKTEWFRGVDKNTASILTFHNRQITANELVSVFENHRRSNSGLYTIVKLDIDNPSVEMGLLDIIQNNSDIVSELYFEYHVHMGMQDFGRYTNFGWGELRELRTTHNVTTALHRFQRLRRMGIRAHPWI